MRTFVIYRHTNTVNGKSYVGQTVCRTAQTTPECAMERRWRRGYDRCRRFCNAIQKYGIDAFAHEVLAVVVGQSAANRAESAWIKKLGTVHPGGYNLAAGGARPMHPESREKIARSLAERWAAMTPEQRSAATLKWLEATTPEQRSAWGHMGVAAARAKTTPEQRLKAAHKASAAALLATTFEQRSVRGRKAAAASLAVTSGQRSDFGRRGAAAMVATTTPAGRSETARSREATKTAEERSAAARKGHATRRTKRGTRS